MGSRTGDKSGDETALSTPAVTTLDESDTAQDRTRASIIGKVAWQPGKGLTFDRWLECGRKLGLVGRGVAWWIGDWILYGNEKYGEKYTRASRVTGYDTQTLMNMAYVASRFSPDRRREALSWSHHAELAALDFDDQEYWLTFAINERLSVRSLRQELTASRRISSRRNRLGSSNKVETGVHHDPNGPMLCPHCQHPIDPTGVIDSL